MFVAVCRQQLGERSGEGGGGENEDNALDNEGDGTYKSISLTSQGPATWPAGDGVNG